jgi:hypothetical protein
MTATIIIQTTAGFVLACDSRSMAGKRIASDESQKLFRLNQMTGCVHSGFAGNDSSNDIAAFLNSLTPLLVDLSAREASVLLWEKAFERWQPVLKPDERISFNIAGFNGDEPGTYRISIRFDSASLEALSNTRWMCSGHDIFSNLVKSSQLFEASMDMDRAIHLARFIIREAQNFVSELEVISSIGGPFQIATITRQDGFRMIEYFTSAE